MTEEKTEASAFRTELRELTPVEVEVSVAIPWDVVSKQLDKSFRELAKTARVKGFRPGKVPVNVVRRVYGPQVKADVTGKLIERGLIEAVSTHEIAIVSQPNVDEKDLKKGEDFEFVAKIEVQPKLESVTTEGLTVKHVAETIEESRIQDSLERLRFENSDLREPEPMRGAENRDLVIIDYAVRVDGELNAELGAEGREVDLGDDGLLEAFKTGLVGMKPGDSKSIEVTFPEDGREDVAGKPAVFEVELKELKERLLPDLDDDFAADVGEFETLDELKADIRERLEKEVATRDESKLREKLIDGLVAINDIPVPPSMVKEQSQQMLYELYQFAQMMGQQLQPGMLEGLEGRAERRVKAGIVLGALARLEKIELEEDAVEKKLASIAEETGKHIAKVRVEHGGERLQQLENQLLEEKIVAFLKSRATIDETPEEESEAKESE